MYVLIKSTYIYIYIYNTYIYIYTHNQFLLKSSYAERKQVCWFLIIFEMLSDSSVIKYKVKFLDCYKFVCLKYKDKFCDSYTAEIHLFEILRQILWLLHQRFICLNVWKLCSAIFDYKVKFLNKKLCSMNLVGWKKLSGNMWLYSWVR